MIIRDLNINEAVIHVLDTNSEEPVLNNLKLELNEDIYKFIYKHVDKCFRSREIEHAIFNPNNIISELANSYFNGEVDLKELSKELAIQLFSIMKGNCNIASCDLLVVSLLTDIGPMVGLLKLDYENNFNHKIEFVNNKVGINIVKENYLKSSGKSIEKAAFIRRKSGDNEYELLVLDKKSGRANEDYGVDYFKKTYLDCANIVTDLDNTKRFISAVERFVGMTYYENAERAEEIRSDVMDKLQEETEIEIESVAEEIIKEPGAKENFKLFMQKYCDEKFEINKELVDKHLSRIKIKIDKNISLSIDVESYKDPSKFSIHKNGDGTINILIKNVLNYIQK